MVPPVPGTTTPSSMNATWGDQFDTQGSRSPRLVHSWAKSPTPVSGTWTQSPICPSSKSVKLTRWPPTVTAMSSTWQAPRSVGQYPSSSDQAPSDVKRIRSSIRSPAGPACWSAGTVKAYSRFSVPGETPSKLASVIH